MSFSTARSARCGGQPKVLVSTRPAINSGWRAANPSPIRPPRSWATRVMLVRPSRSTTCRGAASSTPARSGCRAAASERGQRWSGPEMAQPRAGVWLYRPRAGRGCVCARQRPSADRCAVAPRGPGGRVRRGGRSPGKGLACDQCAAHGRALGCAGSANGLYQSLARQGHRWPYLKRTAAVVRGAPRVRVLVAVTAEGDEHPDGIGWRLAVAALAAEHRAGQGAGDAGDGLDAGDDQHAQLLHPWRLSPGGVSSGPAMASTHCTPSMALSAWGTWAFLPTSAWMSTYALGPFPSRASRPLDLAGLSVESWANSLQPAADSAIRRDALVERG